MQDQPLFIFPSGAKALLLGELRPVVPRRGQGRRPRNSHGAVPADDGRDDDDEDDLEEDEDEDEEEE